MDVRAVGASQGPPGRNPKRGSWGRLIISLLKVGAALVLCAGPSRAEVNLGLRLSGDVLDTYGLTQTDLAGPLLLVLLGLTTFSATVSLMHVRTRRMWNDRDAAQGARIADLQARLDRSTLFLAAEPHLTIAYDGRDGEPEHEGDVGVVMMESAPIKRVLAFTNWLAPAEATELERAIDALRARGERFRLTLPTSARTYVEAQGQAVAGRAVLRLRQLSGERLEIIRLEERLAAAISEGHAMKALLDAVPQPVWLRNAENRLVWANAAYASAVEARDGQDAVARNLELLEGRTRSLISDARQTGQPYRGSVKTVLAGSRRTLDVVDVVSPGGSGGMALDVSELESARHELQRQMDAHVRTLNELPTAVAIFDRRQRLTIFNRAFQDLWQTDARFLTSEPQASEVFDRLRAEGRLPEQSDFRSWKAELLASLQSNEIVPMGWHLPNGRALRVVVSPNPQGGATILFDDVTAQHDLATSYSRLETMQGETLEALSEGVAVFGANGRLQLSNPAFASLWSLDAGLLDAKPHIDAVAAACPESARGDWSEMRDVVCGLPDERIGRAFRTQTPEGRVLASIATPLPEGATLLTTTDITASVEIEQALRERNEALERAARMRDDLVKSVSFELRTPLMSVVGISQILASGTAGPLNDSQRSYASDLMQVSNAVLALFKDILDLTTIEASTVELEISPVDAARCIEEAAMGLQDRLGEAKVKLAIEVEPELGSFPADHKRMRQVLYNLMANAVALSEPGDIVQVKARREAHRVVFEASDCGRGLIGVSELGRVSGSGSVGDHGPGLRLAICRTLVELHGGALESVATPDRRRVVRLILPAESRADAIQDEAGPLTQAG